MSVLSRVTKLLGARPRRGGDLLYYLAAHAKDFHLHVWQYDHTRWGPAASGSHSAGSYHYKHDSKGRGRAFDAYGSGQDMNRFAAHIRDRYGRDLTELIHNPNASIKNGQHVDPSFWGSQTWANHTNHVHVAI